MCHISNALQRDNPLRTLPALARDFGAVVFVLAAFAAAAALPVVVVPTAALVLLPALLLTAVVFGRDSALLAALLAALTAQWALFDPAADAPVGLLPIVVLSGAALAVAALLEELRRRRAEAETAHLRSDTTARRAAERVEAARQQLRLAEARLAEAERRAEQSGRELRAAMAARTSSPDLALASAFRGEGGI